MRKLVTSDDFSKTNSIRFKYDYLLFLKYNRIHSYYFNIGRNIRWNKLLRHTLIVRRY